MRRIIALAFALSFCAPALAQTGVGAGIPSSTTTVYVGPGDVVPGASYFYSCTRSYTHAYAVGSIFNSTPNALCNVRRFSDNHTCDLLVTTNGTVGATTRCSTSADDGSYTFCAGTAPACAVTAMYDQTQHGLQVTQTNVNAQPQVFFTGCGGTRLCLHTIVPPCCTPMNLQGNGLGPSPKFTQPFSISFVASVDGTGSSGNVNNILVCGTSNEVQAGLDYTNDPFYGPALALWRGQLPSRLILRFRFREYSMEQVQ